MAMEDRQRQIKEGAGLEEGRLNTEFIDMMSKWGPHMLTGLALIALAYVGYTKWELWSAEKTDNAFVALNAAAVSGSPSSLESVATDFASQPGVPLEAREYAADLHLNAARTGIPIGAKFNTAADKDPSTLADNKPFLTDEEKKKELAAAETLYLAVAAGANGTTGQTILAIGALNGLASIAEDRGEFDKAKGFYQQVQAKATGAKLTHLAEIATGRIESIDKLRQPPKLYAELELPGAKPFEKPAPPPAPTPAPTFPLSLPPTIAPTPTPAPAPTPAPGQPVAPAGKP